MYATAFACPGCLGSREPTLVSAMRWSFIFAGSIAAIAFAVELHSISSWHGVRPGVESGPVGGVGDAPVIPAAVAAGLAEGAAERAAGAEGDSTTVPGAPQADATKMTASTPPTRRIT